MHYTDFGSYLKTGQLEKSKGPVAMIFVEDTEEVDTTIRHHRSLDFSDILVFAPAEITLPADLIEEVALIEHNIAKNSVSETVTKVIETAPNIWMYYCFNAEYLFFPFCESRNVREMLTFNTEERRDSVLTYIVDLYAGDLNVHKNGVCLEDAHLDKSGYYALTRSDLDGQSKDRQMDFYGGLRWRFEEHVPKAKRRIDRIGLFQSKPGLKLLPNHTFNMDEHNTFACPWHNNMTAAIASFRTAKALKNNPGSTYDIETFRWHNSTRFEWHSQQLMDLGLMEPGQWF